MEFSKLMSQIEAMLILRGMDRTDFLAELNAYLPSPKPVNPANMITVYRWFSGQHTPRPATIRAMETWLEAQTKTKNAS